MSLFNFGKKKDETISHSADVIKQSRILVLGACCQKSTDTYTNVKKAATALELPYEVLNIGDAVEIAKFGVMQTPALVIDNKVVSYGKLISVDEAKEFLTKVLVQP